MKRFVLKLSKAEQRPVANLADWYGFDALIDTGAVFPVWTAGEDILCDLGGKLIAERIPFGGFGGQTVGNLCKLYNVRIGELLFPEFAVVTSDSLGNVPFHVILSATVFSDLMYTIDDRNHRLIVELPDGETPVRKLKIRDSGGRLHILYQSDN